VGLYGYLFNLVIQLSLKPSYKWQKTGKKSMADKPGLDFDTLAYQGLASLSITQLVRLLEPF
jgi:hypothetical protein